MTDAVIAEGDAGSKTVKFTVKLSAASNPGVAVDFTTTDATATVGSDYTAKTGTLTFNPGVTSQTVTVTVMSDTPPEDNEIFTFDLSNAQHASLPDASGQATITSEEFAPASINALAFAAVIASGNAPLATTGTFTFNVAADGLSYTITGDGAGAADSSGTMTYLRTCKETGRINFTDSVLGGGGVILFMFTSTTTASYTMTLAGGNQKGTMTAV